jgi:predicted lipoprotein with Yx(FWY)xxD motif
MAAPGAVAAGDWSLVSRPGEQGRQWAYRGRPLYHYAGHAVMPELALSYDSVVDKGHEHDFEPSSPYFSPKLGWRQAVFDSSSDVPLPADVRLECVQAASGFAFVTASSGVPIYVLDREPAQSSEWTPLYASSAALAVGNFSMVRRDDGTHQWAYKGRRLYTYNGDYSATDVNGLSQSGAHVALAYRLFMPRELAMRVLPTRPPMMVTARGLSVYTQARYHLQYGGRETRGGYHYNYADAKAVGTRGCVGQCAHTWLPVLAPASARSSGFWEVMTRPDGKRQWAYKGSALYTYADDKVQGDIKGNNKAVILYGDEHDHVVTVLGEGFSSAAEQSSDLLTLSGGKQFDPHSYYGAPFGAGFYWHLVPLFN